MGKRLTDKVVVITGGTKGIGQGIAFMAAEEGAKVVIGGRNESEGQQAVRDIADRYGTEALFVQGDISKEAACKQLIDMAVDRFGRVDGLVNNAGIFPRGTITDTTEELFESIFAVNIKGAFFCSKHAILSMQQTGGGSIVQVGSTNAFRSGKDLAAYASSKGALLTLNRHIAAQYGKQNIRSNWITVGWVASEGEIELHQGYGRSLEDLKRVAEKSVPSGKMQTPRDIAYGAIYLLSDEAAQVTGTEIAINGGMGL